MLRIEGMLGLVLEGQADLKPRVVRLEGGQVELQGGQAELRADVNDLKVGQAELGVAFVDLRRHMGVLHEEVLDSIRALGQDDGFRLEVRRADSEDRRALADHAAVGDAVDREHSHQLADHESRLRSLEARERNQQ